MTVRTNRVVAFLMLAVGLSIALLAFFKSAAEENQRAFNVQYVAQTATVVKQPVRKTQNPNDELAPESAKECYDRLGCKNNSVQQCYRCCLGCDSRNQTACQDLCDGSTSALTGWDVTLVKQIRTNPAVWAEAFEDVNTNSTDTVEYANRVAFLFDTGTDIAHTRHTVALATTLVQTSVNQAAQDVAVQVVRNALTDDRDPAIRRTGLAMTRALYGKDSVELWEVATDKLLRDDDESVRALALLYLNS